MHIDISCFFLRDVVTDGVETLEQIARRLDNLSYLLT